MKFIIKSNDGKAILILIIALVLLAVLGSTCAYMYFKANIEEEQVDETNKIDFFNYLSNTNIEKIIDIDELVNVIGKSETTNNEMSTVVSINASNNMWNGYDINKVSLEYLTKKDVNSSLDFSDIKLRYANNDIISVQEIKENNKFAIKSDEVVNKYVSVDLKNLSDILKKIGIITPVKIPDNFDDPKFGELLYLDNNYKESLKNKYKEILYNQINAENFSVQKGVVVNVNNNSYETITYNVVLTENEAKNLCINLLTELKNDEELMNQLTQRFQIIGQDSFSREKIINNIQKYIDKINGETTTDAEKVKLTLCVNEEKVIKIRCDIYNNCNIEIDLITENNINKANITYLNNNENIGNNIVITRDGENKFLVELGFISNGEVNKKISINFSMDGKSTSNLIKSYLDVSYKDNENSIMLKMENKINFTNVNIDRITSENSLFLDSLSDEDLILVRNSILEKIISVYKEKITTLNIINNNLQSTVVSPAQENTENEEDIEQ